MDLKEAIIIFVRKPEAGKVKTRLAAAIGNEGALAVYNALLQHTKAVADALPCDKFVYYSDGVGEDDFWTAPYERRAQSPGDLGVRMQAAFADLFSAGYQRVCIIGSDCLELTTAIIREAFEALQNTALVVGPATDGGYYLLGMRTSVRPVFDGVEWSTGTVLAQTLEKADECACTVSLLSTLNDVDTVADVPEQMLAEALNRPV